MPNTRVIASIAALLIALTGALSACGSAPPKGPAATAATCSLGMPKYSLAKDNHVVITMEADTNCAPKGMTLLLAVFAGKRVTPLGKFETLIGNADYLQAESISFWTKDRDFSQLEVVTLLLNTPAADKLKLGEPIAPPTDAQLRHTGQHVADPLQSPASS